MTPTLKVKGALTALVLSALSLTCVAGELIVHTVSWHSKFNKDTRIGNTMFFAYNNENYGLGWRTERGLMFGTYRNSLYRQTFYIGQELMWNEHLGGFLALGTGYHANVALLGGGVVKLPVSTRTKLELIATPSFKQVDAALHLAVSYRF